MAAQTRLTPQQLSDLIRELMAGALERGLPHEAAERIVEVVRRAIREDFLSPEVNAGSRLPAFLQSAKRLETQGHIDEALDIIYSHIDSLLARGDYERVDEFLAGTPPRELGTDLVLGLLTVTLPAKERLAARAEFFHQADTVLRQRPDWEETLLAGLES